ncbi:MAG: hypothetical protein AAGA54_21465 [Myxococcota bacterium]
MRPLRSLLALSCTLATSLPQLASAAPPALPTAPSEDVDARYAQGQQQLEAGDVAGAAKTWEGLLEDVPESAETTGLREALVINAIDARLAAYERQVTETGEQEPLHLYAAKVTVRRYFRAHNAAHGQTRAVGAVVRERAAALDDALTDAEPPPRPAGPPSASTYFDPVPASAPRPPAPSGPNGNGLLVGGIGVGVLGLATGLTMIPLGAALGRNAENIYTVSTINAFNADSDSQRAIAEADAADAERAGRTANRVAIAGAVISPLLLGGAAAMIVVGLQRRRQAYYGERIQHAPALSPDYAGWTTTIRF